MPRRGSRRRTLVLDGEPWRDVPSDVVSEAGLKPGADVDPGSVGPALAEFELRCARDRVVRLLTYRDRSTSDLSERLAEDGYLPETVASVLERLTTLGLVDDERFARSFARSLTQARGLGRSRALRELTSHGVEPVLAGAALDEALPVERERAAAGVLARTLAARSGATRDKVAGRLARRGYAPRVALEAARGAFDDLETAVSEDLWDDAKPTDAQDGLDGL